jgi:hypothetical protein
LVPDPLTIVDGDFCFDGVECGAIIFDENFVWAGNIDGYGMDL